MSAVLSPASRTKRTSSPTRIRRKPVAAPAPAGERHSHSSHGRRIAGAFAELQSLPVLAEARLRVLSLTEEPNVASSELI